MRKKLLKITFKPVWFIDKTTIFSTTSLFIVFGACTITLLNSLSVPYERNYLIEIYHSNFANPITLPFVYLSIFIAFYKFIFHQKYSYGIALILMVLVACLATQSRGLILSTLIPFIFVVSNRHLLFFAPVIITIFYLRDILTGNFLSIFKIDETFQIKNMFGEMYNTWFGRRLMIENELYVNFSDMLPTTLMNLSGIKLILLPIIKFAASLNLYIPDHVELFNKLLEKSHGFMGVAGSFLTDFYFYPIFSTLLFLNFLIILYFFYSSSYSTNAKFLLSIYCVALIPQLFRWSAILYFTSAIGFLIFLFLVIQRPRKTIPFNQTIIIKNIETTDK